MSSLETLKVAYASDLHLDFEDINPSFFDVEADVLVLAGDTDEYKNWKHQQPFFARCAKQYPIVIVIAGNHEFYHGKLPSDYIKMMEFTSQFPNMHFLQNETLEVKGWKFICATLWTDIDKGNPISRHVVGTGMNDYRLIRQSDNGYRPLDTMRSMKEHMRSKNFILEELKDGKPSIVVSHHAPCSMSINAFYRADHHMNQGYYSDLTPIMFDHPNLKGWIHGHVHNKPHSYAIEQCVVYTNTRGYPGETTTQIRDSFVPQVAEFSGENLG